MLAGVPMIVSDIEPLLEVSAGGKYAKVFPVKDHDALSKKLIEMLRDEGARVELAKQAHRFAEENFSIQAHLKSLKSLYDSLL